MMPLAAFAMAGCLAVGASSDHITAADLAPGFPGLASLPPGTPLALAPAPGVERIFRTPELRQLASRWKIAPPAENQLCVERPVAPLEAARLLKVMQGQLPGASIEILDYSRLPVPEGDLEFPAGGLRQIPGGGFWSGAVRYAGNHRFVIWAKVKVLVSTPRVIVTADLKPARVLAASDLRLEMRQDFPDTAFVTSIPQAAGRVVRRSVAAGTPLREPWLDPLKDVARGETVRVDVWSGGAHLELDAEAEASGSVGDTISLSNPVSKKRFLARIEGKGRVSVGKGNL